MLHLIALLLFTAVGLGTLAVQQVRLPGRRRLRLREMLPGDLLPTPTARVQVGLLDRWERLALQAGLGWSRTLWVAAAGGGLALGLALAALGLPGTGLAAAALGTAGPWLYARRLKSLRSALFARQLPPALFLAASVLRAGGTLLQAVEAITAEMPDPLGAEFRQIQAKMRLQVPAPRAMAEALARVDVREFGAVVVAARLGTEVGGDLAQVFDEIGRAVVDAQNARAALRAHTTEGRLSADLIAALPFAVMGVLQLLSPDYFAPLFATWPGRAVLALSLGSIFLGWRTVRRMIEIRIE